MRKLSVVDIALLAYVLFLSYQLLLQPLALGWDESVYLAEGRYVYSGGEVGLVETLRPPILSLLWSQRSQRGGGNIAAH